MSSFDFEDYDEIIGYVNTLIEYYERQNLERIARANYEMGEEDAAFIATRSFYTMEVATEVNQSVIDLVSSNQRRNPEVTIVEDLEEQKIKPFYYECSYENPEVTSFFDNFTDGETERVSPGEYIWKKPLTKGGIKVKFEQNVTSYLDETLGWGDGKASIGGFDFNFGIEKCFNCNINTSSTATLPKLELLFDINKFINDMQNAIEKLKQEFDPTRILQAICSFGLGFGENLLCPALLSGLNLTLPMLFVKYTFDLLKFRFDWTAIFGPMISAILNYFNQLVGGALTSLEAYFDCAIGILKSTLRWVETIISSATNVVNESVRAFEEIQEVYLDVMDTLAETPIIAPLIDTRKENLEQEIQDLDKERNQAIKKELDKIFNPLNERYEKNILRDYLKDFVEKLKEKAKNKGGLLTLEESTEVFFEYVNEKPDFLKYIQQVDSMKELLRKQQKEKQDKIYNPKINSVRKDLIDEKAYLAKKEDSSLNLLVGEAKQFQSTPLIKGGHKPGDKKTKVALRMDGQNYPVVEKVNKGQWEWYDYAMAKYGVDLRNNYVPRPKYFKDLDKLNWSKAFGDSEVKKTWLKIIKSVEEAKEYFRKLAGKITSSINGLNVFVNNMVEGEMTIAGKILQLVHVVRFINVLVGLFEAIGDGFNCDSILQNKSQVEELLNKERVLDVAKKNAIVENGKNPDDIIKVSAFEGRYTTLVNLKQCGDFSTAFDVNEYNLDAIYEDVTNAYFRTI